MSYIERMEAEETDLIAKINRLKGFTDSEAFDRLHLIDKHLVLDQLVSMNGYAYTLSMRLRRATE